MGFLNQLIRLSVAILLIAHCCESSGLGWGYKIADLWNGAIKNGLNYLYDSVKTIFHRKVHTEDQLCLNTPITQCMCYELFLLNKDIKTILKLDREDLAKSFRKASKYYHPDRIVQFSSYTGDKNEPFRFLVKCFERLSNQTVNDNYHAGLLGRVQDCEASTAQLSDDNLKELVCRGMLKGHNERFILKGESIDYGGNDIPEEPKIPESTAFLQIYIDNSGSMGSTERRRGTKHMNAILPRIMSTNTSVHMLGSKSYSKQLVTGSQNLSDSNIDQLVFSHWNGLGGSTYLWEYVWNSIKNISDDDCSIVVITDGYDNESSGDFNGLEGYNELLSRILDNKDFMCKFFLFCVDSACKSLYRDLGEYTGGGMCNYDSENLNDPLNCNRLELSLNLPKGERKKLETLQTKTYYKRLGKGEAKMLPGADSAKIPKQGL